MIPPVMSLSDLLKIDLLIVVIIIMIIWISGLLKNSISSIPKLFLVPIGDGKRLTRSGIKSVYEMNWWDEFIHSETTFSFTPVQHWSKRGLFDRNKSLGVVGLYKQKDLALYHAGDTGYF